MDEEADKADLYSRMSAAYGAETQKKIGALEVLIIGVGSVGIEVAKNIILSGVKSVTLVDDTLVQVADCGVNWAVSERYVGQPRAAACVTHLKVLNPYVAVTALPGPPVAEMADAHNVVVVASELPYALLCEINARCRARTPVATPFVFASVLGVSACLFSDFGPAHRITDPDGMPHPPEGVESVELQPAVVGADGVVTTPPRWLVHCAVGTDLPPEDGGLVKFEAVGGMPWLCAQPVTVRRVFTKVGAREVLRKDVFAVDPASCPADPSQAGAFTAGGSYSEVPRETVVAYKSLPESAAAPQGAMGFVPHTDVEQMYAGRGAALHAARQALWARGGELPALHSAADAAAVAAAAEALLPGVAGVGAVARDMALYARVEFAPLATFVGGFVAQEVLKACGKYTPLAQWLYADVPQLLLDQPPVASTPTGSRADHLRAIIGQAGVDRVAAVRTFLVGCGALGCELLKLLALLGVRDIVATDMDRIEVSNLSRQFLFRRDNVGKPKSSTAAAAAAKFNPACRVQALEVAVGPATEGTFTPAFWRGVGCVVNALDNLEARHYVDAKCLLHRRPLLESGTLGVMANSEAIIPGATRGYAEGEVPEQKERAIPMCTLRNFPFLPVHCVEWARAAFDDEFAAHPRDAATPLGERLADEVAADTDRLAAATAMVEAARTPTLDAAVRLAAAMFVRRFRDPVATLVTLYPRDAERDAESGGGKVPFWSGTRKFPNVPPRDPWGADAAAPGADQVKAVVVAAAFVFAQVLGAAPPPSMADVAARAASWGPLCAEFRLSDSAAEAARQQLARDEQGAAARAGGGAGGGPMSPTAVGVTPTLAHDESGMAQFAKAREATGAAADKLQAQSFEKDDDRNGHVDFATAATNLRSWEYGIELSTRDSVKVAAGRILPAIASATAAVTGVVAIEFVKRAMELPPDAFRNSQLNLGMGTAEFGEVFPPIKRERRPNPDTVIGGDIVPVPDGFTAWDTTVLDLGGEVTVAEVVAAVGAAFGMPCMRLARTMPKGKEPEQQALWVSPDLSYGIPSAVAATAPLQARRAVDVWREMYGPVAEWQTFVELEPTFELGDDTVETPRVVWCVVKGGSPS